MTVQELIALLQEEDKDALVGTGYSDITGYVQGIAGIKHANHKGHSVVVLDQARESISPDELDIV